MYVRYENQYELEKVVEELEKELAEGTDMIARMDLYGSIEELKERIRILKYS